MKGIKNYMVMGALSSFISIISACSCEDKLEESEEKFSENTKVAINNQGSDLGTNGNDERILGIAEETAETEALVIRKNSLDCKIKDANNESKINLRDIVKTEDKKVIHRYGPVNVEKGLDIYCRSLDKSNQLKNFKIFRIYGTSEEQLTGGTLSEEGGYNFVRLSFAENGCYKFVANLNNKKLVPLKFQVGESCPSEEADTLVTMPATDTYTFVLGGKRTKVDSIRRHRPTEKGGD